VRRRSAHVFFGLLLLGAGGLLALAWRASGKALKPPPEAAGWSLKDYPSLQPERVEVRSGTGVSLSGRFFAGRRRATIVLSHGYGGNQDEMLPAAEALHRAGFSVFTYDQRGCGGSGGQITFGTLEQQDLRSVVSHLSARDDVDPDRIGALGFSMGGASTLMAAASDTRIRAVVADSAWARVEHWLKPTVRDIFLSPNERFTRLTFALIEQRTATRFGDLVPEHMIAKLSPRPLLLVHGEDDDVVPITEAERNFAAAGEPKELWRVPGAGHGETVEPGGALSGDRVAAFFKQALDL
jgi:dipeptidyl aminopeptidase/acylaminoacyl peptidase